jgi:hypothetical protein
VTAAGPSRQVQLGCAEAAMVGCFGLTGLHFIVLSDVARTGSRSAVRMGGASPLLWTAVIPGHTRSRISVNDVHL